jgi:GNAT superfamily N-acetyltransferase
MKPHYRDINQGEEEAACRMVLKSFNEFVAPDYNEEGQNEFKKFVNAESMRDRIQNGDFIIVALVGSKIIGLIEVHSNNHIALLFVDKEWHRQGVAKKLLELAIDRGKENNSDLEAIEVHSSPFAVPVYEKLGFIQSGEERIENGIQYTPMELKIKYSFM